jgi:predicted kinase
MKDNEKESNMKMLYIIRGIPGSGKSTMARKLAPNAAFEADAYMVDQQGNYAFDPSRLGEVHQKCYEAVRDALMQDIANVAVANTFVKRWEYQKYVDLANELGVKYEIIVCNGGYKNIHGVPEEAIQRMKDNWEDTMNEEDNKTEDMNIMNNDIDERYKETNPFPVKEDKPMKLIIEKQDKTILEYNLWYVNMDPTEMSSMSIVKAVYEAEKMLLKINSMYDDYVTKDRVDDINHFNAYNALNVFLNKVHKVFDKGRVLDDLTVKRKKFGEENFSPLHAYSIRTMKGTLKDVTIDEMYVSEMTGEIKHGWKIEFESAVYNKRGQHYKKTWPGVLYLNNTPNGYRLMWSDKKTKTPIWAVSYDAMARRKMVPNSGFLESYTIEFCEELLRPENVLPILKYMPLEHMGTSRYSIHPHGITQSDIYWVGGEVSTKKVLNKAYMHPHGVTKKIFGDINNIKTFDDLRAAIQFLRLVRGFNPQVLEKFNLEIVKQSVQGDWRKSNEYQNSIKSFFTHFGYKDEYILQAFKTFVRLDLIADAGRIFKQIKGRTHRTAIKRHVARSRMDIEEIHNFINTEFSKIQTENKEFIKNDFWNTFGLFDGKWIAEGIQMIVPKMTHDLVEWGAVQNNCIGTYADRVYSGETMVIGFKDAEGKWIGHADITKDMYMTQLLGKHNQALTKETRIPIIKFLKDKLKVDAPSYYGPDDDADDDRFN